MYQRTHSSMISASKRRRRYMGSRTIGLVIWASRRSPDATEPDFPLAAVMGGGYPPLPARPALPWIVNINGDRPDPLPTIKSHSDVAKPEIAGAILNYFSQLY